MLGKDTPRPKYTISAHDGPVSALHVNPHVRGCIATGGMDKTVKIWNVQEEEDAKREISMVTSQDLGVVSDRHRLMWVLADEYAYRAKYSPSVGRPTRRSLWQRQDHTPDYRFGIPPRMPVFDRRLDNVYVKQARNCERPRRTRGSLVLWMRKSRATRISCMARLVTLCSCTVSAHRHLDTCDSGCNPIELDFFVHLVVNFVLSHTLRHSSHGCEVLNLFWQLNADEPRRRGDDPKEGVLKPFTRDTMGDTIRTRLVPLECGTCAR
jgi:WD40 repeat protein